MSEKRNKMLKKLNKLEKDAKEFEEEYSGPGIIKKIKRLSKYNYKYLVYVFARLGFLKYKKIKTFWNKDVSVCISDPVATFIYYFGTLNIEEYKLTKFLIKNLKSSDVFYDIGASYGFYSRLAQEFIKKGEIHLFEPSPNVFFCLKKTFKEYKKVYMNNVAVSNKHNECVSIYGEKFSSEGNTMIVDVLDNRNSSKFNIKSISLDNYIKNNHHPSVLKIDVEGAEDKVLLGAKKLLKKDNIIVILEIWSDQKDNKSHKNAAKILSNNNFKPYKINNKGNLVEVDLKNISKNLENSFTNIVFKKN